MPPLPTGWHFLRKVAIRISRCESFWVNLVVDGLIRFHWVHRGWWDRQYIDTVLFTGIEEAPFTGFVENKDDCVYPVARQDERVLVDEWKAELDGTDSYDPEGGQLSYCGSRYRGPMLSFEWYTDRPFFLHPIGEPIWTDHREWNGIDRSGYGFGSCSTRQWSRCECRICCHKVGGISIMGRLVPWLRRSICMLILEFVTRVIDSLMQKRLQSPQIV